MNSWHEDMLNLLVTPVGAPEDVFSGIERVACQLGFAYVAYGFQAPYPLTKPKITLLNNYPRHWQKRYSEAGYLFTDSVAIHGKKNQNPVLWSDQTFASNPALWEEAQDHGLKTGWAQSVLESSGGVGMLMLSRGNNLLTTAELQAKELQMRWLVQVAHVGLSRAIVGNATHPATPLTPREREVLQWTADGKSAQDIADILTLSKSAVDFHLTNCLKKLNSPNKTAAVAQAVLLGWLR